MYVNKALEAAKISVRSQENDQFGVGRMAHMVARQSRQGACPVRPLSGWLQLRKRLTAHTDRLGRISDPSNHTPLFIGLARARFGLGMAAPVLCAA